MNTNIEFNEMQELKNQLNLLNNKLEKPEIINDKLIRNSLKEKISKINRTGIIFCIGTLIATPIIAFNFHYILHVSLALNIFTCAFMVIAFIYTIWSHSGVNNNLLNGDLITASNTILRTRRRYHQWYYFSWPWFIVWICWVGWEMYNKADTPEVLIGCIVGGIVGGIIGGIWGIRQRNNLYRNIDTLLQQIKDLKAEE